MIGSTAPTLSNLPGKATRGGYVYVIAFHNGTVKVGSTVNPSQRVRFHQTSAAQFAITTLDVWVSPEIDRYLLAEKRLIAAASRMSTDSALREWFWGVDFHALVEIANAVISEPEPETPRQADKDSVSHTFWTRIKDALNVDTNAKAAALCGVSLSTLDRMVTKPGSGLFGNVVKVGEATGIGVEEVVELMFGCPMSEVAV